MLALAACGSGHKHAAQTQAQKHCLPPARVRLGLVRSRRDIVRMRRIASAAHPSKPALSRLTDRFLLDAAYLDPYVRNRLIDHAAAAASAGGCSDCFQALEAERPIPALKYSSPGCR